MSEAKSGTVYRMAGRSPDIASLIRATDHYNGEIRGQPCRSQQAVLGFAALNPGYDHQSRSSSLIEVLERVFSSTRLTITAQ
jgi:hypothetical protein